VRDWPTALRVAHHLLLSHGLAVQALRGYGDVGITLNLHPQRPVSEAPQDLAAARIADAYANRWFLDPVLRGSYPADMLGLVGEDFGLRAGDLETIAQPLGFLGVNYYFPNRVAAAPGTPPLGVRHADPVGPLTTMGWEQDPSGLLEILTRIRRDYGDVPIFITENGAAFDDGQAVDGVVEDPLRIAYLRGHLAAVTGAVAEGVDVRRYYAWSFLDNFEWEHGYAQRFGIVHVDYATQERRPKRSALWYRDHIAGTREERG
jgi:beta-glucosidase